MGPSTVSARTGFARRRRTHRWLRAWRWLPAVLMALASTGACNETDFERFDEIAKLRILTIIAEPPEIGPGETATFTALAVTPAPDAELSYRWDLCAVVGEAERFYDCPDDGSPTSGRVPVEFPETSSIDVPYVFEDDEEIREICALFTSEEIPDFVEVPECERGLPLTLRLTVSAPGEPDRVALKDVMFLFEEFAEAEDRNERPTIGAVTALSLQPSGIDQQGCDAIGDLDAAERPTEMIDLPAVGGPESADGVPTVVACEGVPLTLGVFVPESAVQEYTPPASDDEPEPTAITEQLDLTWFSEGGRVDAERTFYAEEIVPWEELRENAITFDTDDPIPDSGVVRMWLVLRDSRGAVATTSARFRVDLR